MAAKKKKKKDTETSEKDVKDFFDAVKPTPEYIKHLIECRCSLPQFREWPEPPNHKFIVFSELDDNADVKQSYAQCNNCGIIHRVTEFAKSITIKKEELRSLTSIEELESQMLPWLSSILKKNECDLHVWQEAKFIVDNSLWGRFVVLARDREGDIILGKTCQILGNNLHKIESFELDEGWIEPQ